MTISKCIITMALLIASAFNVKAQNSIDGPVNRYSTMGSGYFTSAVERDPVTRKVLKVVKVLERNGSVKPVTDAFRKERKNGSFSEERHDERVKLTLVEDSQRTARVYSLRYDPDDPPMHTDYRITIIIRYK